MALSLGGGAAYYTARQILNFNSGQLLKDLMKHVYVIGQTGTGKTTFLVNRFLKYMMFGSVVFISYKDQKTTEEILESISDQDRDRVIYLSPAEPDRKIGYSIYGTKYDDISRSLYTDSMINIYKMIFGTASIGASSEDIFRMTGLGVSEMKTRTPIEIYRCLSDSPDHRKYREEVMRNVKNPIVKDFFLHELEKKIGNQSVMSAPRNKQRRIVSDPTIARTLCQSSPRLNLEEAINNRKIIIANFNQELLGPEISAFLASFFLSQLQITAFTREDKRVPLFVIGDEFQNYVTPTFGKILSEARSFNMSFTLAHQYTDQIPAYLQSAIDGNVANKYYFRVGQQDAKALEKYIKPLYEAKDLLFMEDYHYLKEIIVNSKKQTIRKEAAPKPAQQYHNADYIKERSKKIYGVSVAEIDRDINKRLGIQGSQKPINEGVI